MPTVATCAYIEASKFDSFLLQMYETSSSTRIITMKPERKENPIDQD